ncbi:MAG: hypothetical protein BWY70_01699 [Bacteroidetes bacterium ADurb.Bin408]|nr:MAG: hypothetical protein BWY70_01699 [Bacteroidetes bacterium ADurb.Bin408]
MKPAASEFGIKYLWKKLIRARRSVASNSASEITPKSTKKAHGKFICPPSLKVNFFCTNN